MYSAFGWNVLKISVRSIWHDVSFKACVSLLIFCFNDQVTGVSGVLKSPPIIVLLSVSPFMSVNIYFMHLGAPMLGAYIFTIVIPSSWNDPFIIMYYPSFSPVIAFALKSFCLI